MLDPRRWSTGGGGLLVWSVSESLFNVETASVSVWVSSKHWPLFRTVKRRFVELLDFGEVIFWFVLESVKIVCDLW